MVTSSRGVVQRQGLALVVPDDHASAQGQACVRSIRQGLRNRRSTRRYFRRACPCHPTHRGIPGAARGRRPRSGPGDDSLGSWWTSSPKAISEWQNDHPPRLLYARRCRHRGYPLRRARARPLQRPPRPRRGRFDWGRSAPPPRLPGSAGRRLRKRHREHHPGQLLDQPAAGRDHRQRLGGGAWRPPSS